MDIRKNIDYLIFSMIIFYAVSFTARRFPNTPGKLLLLVVLNCFVVICYYKLHLSMYYNYPKTYFMCFWVLIGTFWTTGILGLIINVYCIAKAIKMLKNQDEILKGSRKGERESIKYIKNMEDESVTVVEAIINRNKKIGDKTLLVKTMWKKPLNATVTHAKDSPMAINVRNDNNMISSTDNSISNKNKNINSKELEKFYTDGDEGGKKLAGEAIQSTEELENRIRETTGTASGNGIKTIGLSFTKELTNKGYVDLRGRKVENSKDVAVMAQIFRNPQYETFRIIYTKGDEIVGHEAMTSRIPGSTVAF